jgi:hypothetical protein
MAKKKKMVLFFLSFSFLMTVFDPKEREIDYLNTDLHFMRHGLPSIMLEFKVKHSFYL